MAKIDVCPSGNYETGGFVQRSTNDYLYDQNGNQTRDPHKGIDIDYNYYNLPYKITFDNGNVIEWLYGAGGAKLQKQTKRSGVVGLTLDYIGDFEYRNDTLDAIYLADAKLIFDKGTPKEYQYYLRDNVGNNRLVFRDSSGIPIIVNESHYYPNGGLMVGSWKRDSKAKFLYNGIERVNDFGLDIYHAKYRTLDQWTGRWWQIDPEVEQFYAWSPYNQNFGNSVRLSDPEGLAPETIYKNNSTGEEVEVNDGIDKTIEVNNTDFEKAKDFASRSEVADSRDSENGWSQSDQQEYAEFYNSVNSYDEVSLANLYDYFAGGPDDGVIEISLVGGPAGKTGGPVLNGAGKYTFGQLKKALKAAYKKLGVKSLPKGKKGKFGSAQRGDSKKGVRLDSEGHPKSTNPNEDGPHINWWDWTKGKKNKGGKSDAVKIE